MPLGFVLEQGLQTLAICGKVSIPSWVLSNPYNKEASRSLVPYF